MSSNSFKKGWDAFLKIYSGNLGSSRDLSYIENIEKEIEITGRNLNNVIKNYGSSYGSSGGYLAEVWHSGTYNINAAVNKSGNRAWVPERKGGISKTFAQPDIATSDGQLYSLKYMANAKNSAKEQAMSYWERYNNKYKGNSSFDEFLSDRGMNPNEINKWDSIYHNQLRLIPADQIEYAKKALEKKIAQYTSRGLDSSGLKETLSHLTDRVIGKDGIESIPLTKQDSIELAKLAVKGDIELEKFGISVIDLVGYEYILKEALSAGITATFVSVALKLGPSLCQALLQVMKGEVLSPDSLKELGATAISSGGFAFINGAVSASVVTAFKMGVLGKDLMRVNPSWIGCLSTIVVNIVYKLCLLKAGKISSSVFASDIVKDSIVLAGATGLGILAQTVLPVLGPFAFMLGSLVGSMLSSFLYEKVHSALLSLCWKHGLTLFGIVSLDYQIPESILRGVGIKGFDLDSFEMQSFPLQVLQNESFNFDSFELSSFELGIGLKLVNHNVIEAFKVGYSFV